MQKINTYSVLKRTKAASVLWFAYYARGITKSLHTQNVGFSSSARKKSLHFVYSAVVSSVVFVLVASLASLFSPINSPAATEAAVNDELNYQARLLKPAGDLVLDGDYSLEFKLYNASTSSGSSQGSCAGDTNCLWTETYTGGNVVRVVNGYITVNLGSITTFPSTIDWSQELWLTLNVGGIGGPTWDGEMTPRTRVTAVPYAFSSGAATKLSKTDSGFTTTLEVTTPTANNTLTLPDVTGTVCISTGNCVGTGGAGSAIGGSGTLNTIALFTPDGNNIGNSILTQTGGTTISVGGALAVTGASDLVGATTLGDNTTAGSLLISDGSSNYATIGLNALASDYTINIPTITANDTFCLFVLSNCAGGGGVSSLNTFTGALSVLGTANEIEVSNSTPNITIGLPDDVTIGDALTVTGATTLNGSATIGDAVGDTLTVNAGTGSFVNNFALTLNNSASAFAIDGTTFVVDALNNRVGIGTGSPGNTLDIVGDTRITSTASSSYGTIIFGDNNASRYLRGNAAELQIGSTLNNLRYLSTGANIIESDSIDGTTALRINARIAHTSGDLFEVSNNGTTALTVNYNGLLTTTGGLNVNSETITDLTGAGLINSSNSLTVDNLENLAGTLDVGNGGTGLASATLYGLVYGNGTSALGVTAAGTTGQCLIATTSSAPSWGACPGAGGVSSLNTFTGALSVLGTANEIEVSNSTPNITIGLPDDVTITNNLTVTNLATANNGLAVNKTAGTVAAFNGTAGQARVDINATGTDYDSQLTFALDNTNFFSLGLDDSNADTFVLSASNALGTNNRLIVNSAGNVGIGTGTADTRLDIIGSTGSQLRLRNSSTNSVNKTAIIQGGSYLTAEEDATAFYLLTQAAANDLSIGGGYGSQNAATSVALYTAANNTTLTGTSRLAINSSGQVTLSNLGTGVVQASAAGLLSSSALNISGSLVTGTLAVGNGGTGLASATLYGLVYGNGTSALGVTAAGTTGQCLIATTSSAPSWGACPGAGGVSSLNTFTGALSVLGTANEIEVSNSTPNITIGLPDDVTIGDALTVTGLTTLNGGLNVNGNSTFDSNADTIFTLNLDAGLTTAQQTRLGFLDRGTEEWRLFRTPGNNFRIDEMNPTTIIRLQFFDAGDTTFRTGSATADYNFQDESANDLVTIDQDGLLTTFGDLAVNGGDLTTNQTTFNLLNTTATTLNVGGAATTLSLGAATGTTTVNNSLTVAGNAFVDADIAGTVALRVQAAAAQTANILEVEDSAGLDFLVVDSNGDVGINEDTPLAKLHVRNSGSLYVGGVGGVSADTVAFFQGTNSPASHVGVSIVSGNTGRVDLNFGDTDDEDVGRIQYDNNTNTFNIRAATSESVYINSTGLGIGGGASGISALLHVSTSSSTLPTLNGSTDALIVDSDSVSSDAILSLIGGNGAGGSSRLFFGDSDDEDIGNFEYDHSNNELIVTVNTQEFLTFDGTNDRIIVGNSTNDIVLSLDAFNTDPTSAPDGSMFYDADGEVFRCRVNGSWVNCDTSGSGGDTTVNFFTEYTDSILYADGSNNSGTLATGYATGLSAADGRERTYYNWSTAQGTAQDYDIIITHELPSDFSAFVASSFKIWTYEGAASGSTITFDVYNATDNLQCITAVDVTPAEAATNWEEVSAGSIGSCTPSAGDKLIITIRVGATSSTGNIRVGEFEYEYTQ